MRRKRLIIWVNGRGAAKLTAVVAMLFLVGYLLMTKLPATETWTHWTMPLSGKVVALDAGHGGPDGGAVSADGLIEKQVTLAITRYLRDYLQQAGAVVILTRDADADLAQPGTKGLSKRKTEDLHARADRIKASGADLLVSIHLNSIPSAKWSGAQTFYAESNAEGRRLAMLVQDELRRTLGYTDRRTQPHDTSYLLKAAQMPGALVEVGFLSNPEEAARLAKDEYQKQAAATIYRGILRFVSGERPDSDD